MTRSFTRTLCLLVAFAASASAQDKAPAAAKPAAPPKAEAKAKTKASAPPKAEAKPEAPAAEAPAQPAADTVAAQAPEAAPAQAGATAEASAQAAPAATAKSEDEIFRARLAAERARLQAMLAARRAASQRNRAPAPPVKHGDAGAALALGVSLESFWVKDVGYDLFADDDVTQRPGVWASYDIVSFQPDLIMAAEAGWATDSEDRGAFGGDLATELQAHQFHAGLRLRWVLVDILQPHVRLAGGLGLLSMKLDARQQHYEDKAKVPFGSLGAGFLLRTPTRLFETPQGTMASVSVGVLVEGGYTLVSPAKLALEPTDMPTQAIDLQEPALGELSRSGPYVRTSLVLRFGL